ncbi:base excision DNA repair protein [Paraphoma chrysanthemicola]|uniref:Base excision DNA repair protein n=1 Tax=Paraphoma chrysanthemicola TaxID=798071 RepID=A0A8K0W1X2_9PLEO|nr:base excision DNA repair protein [Paraphoma chrysanthemicola]
MARATRSAAAKSEAAKAPDTMKEPVQLSSPPATPAPRSTRKRKATKEIDVNGASPPAKSHATPRSIKRAKKGTVKKEDVNDLPHGLGAIPDLPVKDEEGGEVSPARKAKTPRKSTKAARVKKEEVDDVVEKATSTTKESPKKKAKNNNYGLKTGETPYPNWPHPTADECEEVTRLLSKVHGKVEAPKTIPTPSLEVSGCGEVPSVLDALIRTRLSAATSGTNSSRAFTGLVSKFGILQSGIGKGSVDWNKVRLADTKDVFEAIKSGGLADVKSKDIKKILQMVWEENQDRRQALLSAKAEAPGESNEPAAEKTEEVAKAENDVVSLDHLHLLSTDDAFAHLTKYPGIGPKTASCVLLFCLQRPSFAVDTHVFRLCKWLGWVPPAGDPAGLPPNAKDGAYFAGPTRNSTYAHCEVRVPDHLKYPLHQLLIRHGKSCPRCRAITGEGSAGWDEGCPIEELVQRTGERKGGGDDEASPKKGGAKKGGAKKVKKTKAVVSDDESEAAMSESEGDSAVLSDLVSDAEIEVSEDEEDESE